MNSKVEHKNIIFGLGKSGMSCAHYFERKEIPYTLIDTRTDVKNKDELKQLKNCKAVYFGSIDPTMLDSCDRLIVSPGISLKHPFVRQAKSKNIDVCGDVELFARECDKKIIAITGSNGKSTVTELTQLLIATSNYNVQMAGNIGLPVLDYLAKNNNEALPDIFVLELSSFQLDLTQSLTPDIAVLLNISEDHLDRYDSFEDYADSKYSIFNGAKKRIYNLDDSRCIPKKINPSDYGFSIGDEPIKVNCNIAQTQIKDDDSCDFLVNQNSIIDSKQLSIIGSHNYANVLASLSIVKLLNIDIDESVLRALCNYKGMNHRFQLVSKKYNCFWINDSKATNVGATIAALENFDSKQKQRLILIAGGDSKKTDLKPLKIEFEDKVDSLILFGKDATILAALSEKIKTYFVDNMQNAIGKAKTIIDSVSTPKPTTVLLSPACSSLDMFNNFEDRGEQFIQAIEVLK